MPLCVRRAEDLSHTTTATTTATTATTERQARAHLHELPQVHRFHVQLRVLLHCRPLFAFPNRCRRHGENRDKRGTGETVRKQVVLVGLCTLVSTTFPDGPPCLTHDPEVCCGITESEGTVVKKGEMEGKNALCARITNIKKKNDIVYVHRAAEFCDHRFNFCSFAPRPSSSFASSLCRSSLARSSA